MIVCPSHYCELIRLCTEATVTWFSTLLSSDVLIDGDLALNSDTVYYSTNTRTVSSDYCVVICVAGNVGL